MGAGYTFGGITSEYVLSNQMSNTNVRGFWCGDSAHTNAQGAMALTTQGYLTVASRIRVGYGESDTTTPSKDLDVSGEASIGSLMVGATTTPAQQLQVKDTTNYHGILVNGSNAPNVCFDRSTGTTPEWKVGISGNTGTRFASSKGTANDDKLRINTSGYIEMPNQPCFGVAKNNGYQTDDAVFVCDQATGTRNHNDGSHYNTSNGRFTAPVAGRYFFSFSVMTHDSGSVVQAWIALRKNGSIIQYNLQHKTGGYHTRFDMTYTIKLAANDYIEAYVGESGTSSGWRGSASEYDNFSGFLIG